MKKTVIFDFFGVISSEVSPFWFAERFDADEAVRLKDEYMTPADHGDLSEEEVFLNLARLSGETPEAIRADFLSRVVIDGAVVDLIKELKKEYKVVLLSNAMGSWLADILRQKGLVELFDEIVLSSLVGLVKPEAEIYRLALSRADSQPSEAVFIDDNPKNVAGAGAVGIDGILFSDIESLRTELVLRGVKLKHS